METGDEYNFTRDGIRHMREEINKHQFPLVIIDSLSSMMEPTGTKRTQHGSHSPSATQSTSRRQEPR